MPSAAGICIALLNFNGDLPKIGADQVNFTIDASVVMSFDGETFRDLGNGEFQCHGSLTDLSSFRILPRNITEPVVGWFKNYDWKCFQNCAPNCSFCAHSIECWAICAGACFALCAF
jgi:hypothetical protein